MNKIAGNYRLRNEDHAQQYYRDIGIKRVLPLIENTSSSSCLNNSSNNNDSYIINQNVKSGINWRDRPLEERVMWDWKEYSMKKLRLVSHKSRGISKSKSHGLNFFNSKVSLGETGFILALLTTLVGIVGTVRDIWSLTSKTDDGTQDSMSKTADKILNLLSSVTVVIMGIIGTFCAKMNHSLDKLNGNITDRILYLPNNNDEWWKQRKEQRYEYLKSKELRKGLANSVRVDGPRFLLIGICMFLVNDVVNILGELVVSS